MASIDINGNLVMEREAVKMTDEKTYRTRLLAEAKYKGCEKELQQIFNKYDSLLRNCSNAKEREQIGMLGVLAVSKLIDNGYVGEGGSLIVNGQLVIDSE